MKIAFGIIVSLVAFCSGVVGGCWGIRMGRDCWGFDRLPAMVMFCLAASAFLMAIIGPIIIIGKAIGWT